VAASSLVGFAVTGVLGGLWLDRRFDSAPLWLLVGSLAGIVLGMYQLIRQAGRG
jgi:F0F1-type ATP synthase assembly protein I